MAGASWRLLRDPSRSAAWNMSIDEALLCCALGSAPTLRLYTWERPSVSLGYRQSHPVWIDRCAELGIDRVRRASGGGTVIHAGDLTYSVVAPLDDGILPSGLEGSYEWIRNTLVDGLRQAGLDARASSPQAEASWLDVCFAGATGYEVEVAGAKLVGSAQRRTSWALLQHGSIRLCDDSGVYTALLGEVPEGPGVDGTVTPDAAASAIVRAFDRALGGGLESGVLDEQEWSCASRRVAQRRRDPLVVPPLSLTRLREAADRLP